MPTAPPGAGNVTSAGAASAGSLTIDKPANVANGDLLIASVRFQNSGQTIAAPSGWTSVITQATNWSAAIFYKLIPTASAETATNYTFSVASGAARWVGMIFRVVNAASSGVIDVAGTYSPATGTSSTVAPTITPSRAGGLLLDLIVSNIAQTAGTGVAFTPPSGMTAVGGGLVDNGSQTSQVWVGQEQITSAAATGTRTVTMSPAASNSQAVLLAVNPGAQPPTVSTPTNVDANAGAATSLSVTATADGGGSLTYAWSVVGAQSTNTPTLTGATTATVSFTAPAAGNLVTVQCVVTDTAGLSTTVTGEVRVPVPGNITVVPLALAGTGSGWTRVGGSGSDAAALADTSDTTYMESGPLSATATTRRYRLQPSRARSSLSLVNRLWTDAGTGNVTIRLYEQGTVRQSWTHAITDTPTDFTDTASAATISAITDFGNLYVEVGATT